MSKLDWRKAQPYRPTESKVAPGTVLPNGAIVPNVRRDDLSKRANQAMDRWLRTLSPRDRDRVRFAK
jgi:hypothetical protein